MATKRKAISKKIRFEVFKRDKFTCQYCGRMAPDVVLEVDHIQPVAKGGTNDIMNLVTSCYECNRGKRDVELSDDSVLKKQQEQLALLATKHEQLEMMLEWRNGLVDIVDKEVEKISEYYAQKTGNKWFISNTGKKGIKKLLREFSIIEILDAMDIAFDTYYIDTESSASMTLNKISGICHNRNNGRSEQTYWFNYLKKAAFGKYGGEFSRYVDRLKVICFRHMKNKDDFNDAKTMLYDNDRAYWYIEDLEGSFK